MSSESSAEHPERPTGADPDEATADHSGLDHDESGTDLARSVTRGLAGRTGAKKAQRAGARRRVIPPKSSGSHPDARDPQTLDASLDRLINERGWVTDVRVHSLFVRWSAIVGRDVAEHVVPVSFEAGRLVVQADTTAWATQMRLLAANIVARLNEEMADETVRFVDVLGPRQPTWVKGKLRVKGRGPRDTYG